MAAQKVIPYRKAQVPTLDAKLSDDERLYYDQQLSNIQKTLTSLQNAITQLQQAVTAASAFPIVLP